MTTSVRLCALVAVTLASCLACTSPDGPAPASSSAGPPAAGVVPLPTASALPVSGAARELGMTEEQYLSVVGCATPERGTAAPELVGVRQGDVRETAGAGSTVRVVGRDGSCAPQDAVDHRAPALQDRVNLVLEHGVVVWAGRY